MSSAGVTVTRSCPACEGALAWWAAMPVNEAPFSVLVDLWRCRACGTAVTAAPAPDDAHSAGAYRPGPPRGARLAAPLLAAFDRQRLSLLPSPPGRLVDAGAGRGRFVVAARHAGWDAVGFDPRADTPTSAATGTAGIEGEGSGGGGGRAASRCHLLPDRRSR